MTLHRCTEQVCPHFGQRTDKGCLCHQTDEQMLLAVIGRLLSQLDHAGCTCTFPSEDCCGFSEATKLLRRAK